MTQRVQEVIPCVGNSSGLSGKFTSGIYYFILHVKTSVNDLFTAEDKYKSSSDASIFPHWVFSGDNCPKITVFMWFFVLCYLCSICSSAFD